MRDKLRRPFLLFVAVISWLGVFLVLYNGFINNPKGDVIFSLTNVLSYFTVQSNILVALFSTYLLTTNPKMSKWGELFFFGSVVNISVTGIIYATVLAGVWDPKGIEFVVNMILHYFTPVLYVLYWFFLHKRFVFNKKFPIVWLFYPVAYIVYTLLRAPSTGFYPYPFIDLSQISLQQFLINSSLMGIFIIFIGYVVYFLNNRIRAK